MKYPQIVRDNAMFTSDIEVCNIGYNEGLIDGERPYRIEIWSTYEVTMATVFMSKKDLEKKSEDDLKEILLDNEIIEIISDNIYVTTIIDDEENEFYNINIPIKNNGTVVNNCLLEIKPYEI